MLLAGCWVEGSSVFCLLWMAAVGQCQCYSQRLRTWFLFSLAQYVHNISAHTHTHNCYYKLRGQPQQGLVAFIKHTSTTTEYQTQDIIEPSNEENCITWEPTRQVLYTVHQHMNKINYETLMPTAMSQQTPTLTNRVGGWETSLQCKKIKKADLQPPHMPIPVHAHVYTAHYLVPR